MLNMHYRRNESLKISEYELFMIIFLMVNFKIDDCCDKGLKKRKRPRSLILPKNAWFTQPKNFYSTQTA